MQEDVRYVVRRAHKFMSTFQAELRGHYSAERMRHLLNYSRTTSRGRAILVSIVSPFPCLFILTLIDAAPLASPTAGSAANFLFWGRDFLTIALMTRVILEQFRISVPGLHINSFQVVAMPILSSAGTIGFMVAMSSLIGFPLPFALVVGVPVWFVCLVICFVVFFGRVLRRDPALLRELLQAIVVLILQVLLTFVYPAYLYGFIQVGTLEQKFYVLLLPVIKIIAKNWISFCLERKYDLMPQIMIFNVDVFNALYVSSTMQNSRSVITTLQMVALDVVLGGVSVSDITDLMRGVNTLRRKIPPGHPLKAADFVAIALHIIEKDPEALESLAQRRYSSFSTLKRLGGITVADIRSHRYSISVGRQIIPVEPANVSPPTPPVSAKSSLQLLQATKAIDNIFSPKERKQFVQKSARVLFTTEFIILVVYTKVIVPFIYTMYTLGMFYFPNRDFYPEIQSFVDSGPGDKLGSVIMYGFLELLLMFIFGYLIQRMLGISMLHLLSFVLDKSWRMVQSNLFLWICYTIQNSLEHNGADFSFKFSWLKG